MALPDYERVIYKKNPLERVSCALFFKKKLSLGSEVPQKFYSGLKSSYAIHEVKVPEVEEEDPLPPELLALLKRLSDERTPTHVFRDKKSSRVLELSSIGLEIIELKYVKREDFLSKIERAEKSLVSAFGALDFQAVKICYTNVIRKESLGLNQTPWDQLLRQELLGLLSSSFEAYLDIEQTRSLVDFQISLENFSLVRCELRHGLGREAPAKENDFYVIETEFTTKDELQGGTHRVHDFASKCAAQAGKVFRSVIKPALHEALQPG